MEYAGPTVRALSMEGRLTLCNLSIEGGARCGMVAPDDDDAGLISRAAPSRRQGDDLRPRPRRTGRRCTATGAPPSTARWRSTRRDRADRDLGHQPRGRAADHRPACRIPTPPPTRQRRPPSNARRSTTWGCDPGSRSAISPVDHGLHRLLHQRAGSRICAPPPPCCAGRRARRAGAGVAGVQPGEGAGGGRGARPHVHRGRAGLGRLGLFDVRGHERRPACSRANAAPRPPTAISGAGRGRARART